MCTFHRFLSTSICLATLVGSFAIRPAVFGEEPAPETYELTVSPAAEPVPALKYHLLPPLEDQVPGNAVPIYLRIIFEHASGEWHRLLRDKPGQLLEIPIDDLPLDEASKVLSTFEGELRQMTAAGKRSYANWEYVQEEDPLTTLLPDAQSMRSYARLIALRARYEVRQGNPLEAVASLRDGLALARHVSDASFLVNQFVGVAVAKIVLAEVDQVVCLENAPNLYWALAELPKPLIPFSNGLATESQIIQLRFPELVVPKASINWGELSERMRRWAVQVVTWEETDNAAALTAQILKTPSSEQLDTARDELSRMTDYSPEEVAAMSDSEIEVRYTLALHGVIYDAWRKWYSVPYFQALPKIEHVTEQLQADARRREIYPLVSILAPLRTNLSNLLSGPLQNTRQIARQQVIEALRMHAAQAGKLPTTLDEVTVVPVPLDPATGGPFAYKLEDGVATLDVTDLAGMQRDILRVPVKVRLRQGE